jgi:hypothetical protein
MKNSAPKFLSSLSLAPAGLASALVIILLGTTAPRLAAQSDNFNSAPPLNPYWQLYALPYYGTPTYSYPADDSGGKAFEIYAPPTGDDPGGMGNARAGAFRVDAQYTGRFSVGTDLLAWNASWFQEAGILFYLQTPGLGTSAGYTATYSSAYRQLYISSITGEVPTTVAELGTGAITLDPTHRYRLVASCNDPASSIFLFQLFDKSEPNSPWASAIGQDSSYQGVAGYCGLFVFEQHYPSTTEGADATFDNYVATTPAAGAMPATVTDLSPPPAGKATAFYPTITVGILDRDTKVDTNSIVLCLDGVWITNASLTIDPQVHKPNPAAFPKDFDGATVTYSNGTLYAWGSKHTNIVAFMDSASNWQTNTWTWTTAYPNLFASNSLPLGSLAVRGFDARMVQSLAANIGGTGGLNNSVASAQAVLNYQYAVDLAATNIVPLVAWDIVDPPSHYGAVTNFPGLCLPPWDVNSYAIQVLAYLQLTAGVHKFHIDSDDSVGIYSGASLTDTSMVLYQKDGVAHADFEVAVPADGLYPFNIIFEQGGGDAYLCLYSVNPDTSTTLVNAAAGLPAFYPVVCRSSATVKGPYTGVVAPSSAGVTTTDVACTSGVGFNQTVTAGTFTIPVSSTPKFYRLDGPRATKITNISKDVSNVVITYQVQ